MKDRKDFSKVIADISILYELSLAVGQSLDLQTSCNRFLKTLMARKNLGYSSVWIKGEYLVDLPEEILLEDRDENSAFLVYANPEFRIKEKSIPPHHLIFSMLEGKEAFLIASTEDRFSEIITEKGIDKGIFAIFSLGKLGFLKLFSMARETLFREEELNQLKNVISKFTVSLEGCIAHQKVIREISERKQVEEALRESEEKYRSLVNNIKLGIFRSTLGPSGKFIEVNLAMEEITGYSREELLSMNVSDLYVRPEERETVVVEVAAATGKTTKELNFRKKDGTKIVVSDTKVAVRDNTGKVLYFDGIIEDITERKRAEEALRASEGRLRHLFDDAPVGYHEFDTEGRITRVNRTELEMLGYTAEEMLGRYIWDFIVEEVSREAVKAKLAGKLPPSRAIERTYQRKDGTTFPVLIEDRLIKDGKGRITGIRTTIQDITERKRAEEALRRSEEAATQLAQENAVVAEIGRIINSTLNIEEVYERFAEEVHKLISFDRIAIDIINHEERTSTIAYTAGVEIPERSKGETFPLAGSLTEEVLRTRSSFLIQLNDKEELARRFPRLLPSIQAKFKSLLSVPLFSKDRVIGVFHIRSTKPNAYSERDLKLAERVGNQIVGAIANAQLFAERKRAEEALQESEEQLRLITDSLPVLITYVDNEQCYRFNNKAYEEWFGYSSKEIYGKHIKEVLGDQTYQAIRRYVERALSGQPVTYETVFPHKSGGARYVNVTYIPHFGEKGEVKGYFALVNDITERNRAEQKAKSLEEQLRQSQRIEAIGRLAGGIAHDFNNILTVIKGYSELSLIKLKEGDPLKGNIQEIQKASQRAADLTRQLLAFSRRQVMEMKVLDINILLKDLDKMLRRIIGEDIELVTFLTDDIGRVKTDPGQIEQLILNLAVNARDAMSNGGKLTLETANVDLDETYARTHIGVKPGHYVMVSVSDTGVGMTPEVKEHLFEPFFTTKEKGKGTGLGLSTVYGIVKQSAGEIWVYSEPGQGTTFKIYLPRVDEEAGTLPHGGDKGSLPRGRETILLVEDELSVRDLAVQVLRENGYNLLEAANGNEALRVVQENAGKNIHLLLTDVVMPQMGGKELADRLKPLQPDIKVLFTSGYTDNAIVNHGVLEPGINFLQKPFPPKEMVRKVREVLDK